MEILEKDETLEEKPEEEIVEEEKAMNARLEKLIMPKLEKLVSIARENPVKASPAFKSEPSYEKSILETDPYLRSKRPFVKLSRGMEKFVSQVKTMVREKAMSEGDNTAGGFFVPEEFNSEVVRYVSENVIVRPRARVFNMSRDTLTLPKLDQSTYQFGGATIYWPGESASITESSPSTGRITLNAYKMTALTYVSDELLSDSAVNVANFLVGLIGELLVYTEDSKFLTGTGISCPLGITKASGVNYVTRTSSTRILADDIIGMYQTLPAWADKNAVWICTKEAIGQLMKMGPENTGVNFVWMPNIADNVPGYIMGKPILVTDKLEALGTAGDIIFGNLDYYYIGDRGGIEVATSIHTRFAYGDTALRFTKRIDGQPALANAFAILRE